MTNQSEMDIIRGRAIPDPDWWIFDQATVEDVLDIDLRTLGRRNMRLRDGLVAVRSTAYGVVMAEIIKRGFRSREYKLWPLNPNLWKAWDGCDLMSPAGDSGTQDGKVAVSNAEIFAMRNTEIGHYLLVHTKHLEAANIKPADLRKENPAFSDGVSVAFNEMALRDLLDILNRRGVAFDTYERGLEFDPTEWPRWSDYQDIRDRIQSVRAQANAEKGAAAIVGLQVASDQDQWIFDADDLLRSLHLSPSQFRESDAKEYGFLVAVKGGAFGLVLHAIMKNSFRFKSGGLTSACDIQDWADWGYRPETYIYPTAHAGLLAMFEDWVDTSINKAIEAARLVFAFVIISAFVAIMAFALIGPLFVPSHQRAKPDYNESSADWYDNARR